MRLAFTVEDTHNTEAKLDPRYVKAYVRVVNWYPDKESTETVLNYHECTEDDWAEFAPPDWDT